MIDSKVSEDVKNYYGKVLSTNEDLKTTACCAIEAVPEHIKPILSKVHDEVMAKFYGCGSPIPPELEGRTVLDLGSGSGRDCFVFSKMVGPKGRVIGVDMTDEQIAVANKYVDFHTEMFGFVSPNVEFRKSYIEDLRSVDIADNSMDIVTSNCVLNLSTDKEKVFEEIFRVLKPGGELFFSDVFSDRRISKDLADDPVLRGECLGGAMYIEDFRRLLNRLGCSDYRFVSTSKLEVTDQDVARKVGHISFYSNTVRAFKLNLEDRCEDYGQVAYYQGTLPESPHSFILDDHHEFFKGRPMLVCSNTARMISETRFAKHFKIVGDESTHYGLFDCVPIQVSSGSPAGISGACC